MSKIKNITIKSRDTGFNLLNKQAKLHYITEPADWSVRWDGKQITEALNRQGLVSSRITTSHLFLKDKIVHFGSVGTFLTENGFRLPHKSNKIVLTWFHVTPDWERNKNIKEAQEHLSFLHTSCNITKNALIKLGVKEEKIKVIPLGVDLSVLAPSTQSEKDEYRKKLGIPKDKTVIGSFQKDGVGWGAGLEPKMVKGPDIFVKSIEVLSKKHPVFVLLVGPARGYVEQDLKKIGVPYKSIGFVNFTKIPQYYKALDLYVVSSRVEGGPKAVLEAMASGVPLVTTRVGMAADIADKNPSAFLSANIDDYEELAKQASKVIQDNNLKQSLIQNGLDVVRQYSWDNIAKQYYEKIYKNLL